MKELERRIKALEYELVDRWIKDKADTVRFIQPEEYEKRKLELGYPADYDGLLITDIVDGKEVRCER